MLEEGVLFVLSLLDFFFFGTLPEPLLFLFNRPEFVLYQLYMGTSLAS